MNDENELLEPLATEAGQEAIVRAIRDISSLEYAVRAEQAASTASVKAGEASQSALEASDAESKAKDWATKTNTYVEQLIITIPPAQEGEEPTTETINLYSAKYYAALALDIYNNMSFDSVPTENSTNMVNSGTVYSALDLKADKSTTYTKTEVDTALNAKADLSTTYTKTEVDTALSNVQSTLTFDNVPTANSDNPVKSSGIKTALDGKQDNLTFDSTPTANSTNPVTSGGVYTALQNVNIDIDDEITEDSDNPVTSAAIYEALLNFTPSGGGGAGNASGTIIDVLYESENGYDTNETDLSLNKSINDYDFLVFVVNRKGASENKLSESVTIDSVEHFKTLTDLTNGGKTYTANEYGTEYLRLAYKTDTVIRAIKFNTLALKYIYGIKFSKNLSEQMYSNVLWDGKATSGNVTLSDNIDNYDFLYFELNNPNNSDGKNYHTNIIDVNFLKNTNVDFPIELIGYDSRYVDIYYASPTTLTIKETDTLCIRKIVGYKLAKGGYSGIVSDARMTVKSGTETWNTNISKGTGSSSLVNIDVTFDSPMPDTNYIVSAIRSNGGAYSAYLKVTIGNKTVNGFMLLLRNANPIDNNAIVAPISVDWIAIRPNSYTREGMVEDVLFSDASGVNSGTINLSGNISDYDLIYFWCEQYSSGNTTPEFSQYQILPSNLIQLGTSRFMMAGYDNYYCDIKYISDSILDISNNGNMPIYKITGIKFGRYVSGVAVDTTVTQNSNAVVTSGAVYDALQNYTPSGGGSSVTVDSTITQGGTNPVEGGAIYTALDNKADKSTTYTKTEVDTALSSKGDVTTDTAQNITGTKTFVGSKKVAFKQSAANDKLGFTLFGNTGTERGYLEFNPTNTVDGVAGLMTLGNYATSAASLTQVGFRRYSNISGASGAYNLLMPMVADARTPFSLTTTYTNFYLPLGFKNGTTIVKADKSGVVDISSLLASLEARVAALEGN